MVICEYCCEPAAVSQSANPIVVTMLPGKYHSATAGKVKLQRKRRGARLCTRWFLCAAVASVLLVQATAWADPPLRASSPQLPLPNALVPQVKFWIDVFTRYSYEQVILHDRTDVSVIYEVVKTNHNPWLVPASGYPDDAVEAARSHYADLLARLCFSGPVPGQFHAFRLVSMMTQPSPREVYCRASANIRAQRGLRESFAYSLLASRLYLRSMRKILRQEGVPAELVYIPHVESSFRPGVTSKAGAAGIWQLTRDTAALYARVGHGARDQRYDPVKATRIAAKHLRRAFDRLGSWPLAVVAYNHGLSGVMRAKSSLGTSDVTAILRGYNSALFGFASRNFYPEVLAAIHVAEHADWYFPDLKKRPVVYVVQRGDSLWSIARQHGVSVGLLKLANGLDKGDLIREGQRLIVKM